MRVKIEQDFVLAAGADVRSLDKLIGSMYTVASGDPMNTETAHSIDPNPPGQTGPKPIVFVVDDDISVRESLELLIPCVGWTAECFESVHLS